MRRLKDVWLPLPGNTVNVRIEFPHGPLTEFVVYGDFQANVKGEYAGPFTHRVLDNPQNQPRAEHLMLYPRKYSRIYAYVMNKPEYAFHDICPLDGSIVIRNTVPECMSYNTAVNVTNQARMTILTILWQSSLKRDTKKIIYRLSKKRANHLKRQAKLTEGERIALIEKKERKADDKKRRQVLYKTRTETKWLAAELAAIDAKAAAAELAAIDAKAAAAAEAAAAEAAADKLQQAQYEESKDSNWFAAELAAIDVKAAAAKAAAKKLQPAQYEESKEANWFAAELAAIDANAAAAIKNDSH
jgi:hypothetical protein